MRRRCFLKLTGAGGLAAVTGLPALAAAGAAPAGSGPAAAAVIVSDVSPTTDAANLIAVLETFGRNGLAVTCAVRPPEGALDGYDAILGDLAALGPALDLALDLPDLASLSPHFQARAAFEALARFAGRFGEAGAPAVRTILCDAVPAPTAPIGVRSAGIRNVIVRPGRESPVTSETWPNGVVRFFGGVRLSPLSPVLPSDGSANIRLFHISAESFAGVPEQDLRTWAARLSDAVFEAELAGAVSPMPVSELQLRDDFGFARHVVLRLVGVGPAVQGFAEEVRRRGVPVLVESDPQVRGYWVPEPLEGDEPAGVVALAGLACGEDGQPAIAADGALPSGVAVLPVAGGAGPRGLNACAVLEIGDIRIDHPLRPGAALIPPAAQEDAILTIGEAAIATPGDRAALLAAIEALGQDGISRFVALDGMVNGTLSHEPIERRFRRTRGAGIGRTPPQGGPVDDAAYMADARLAWAFFERFTDPNTGLAPATANVRTGGDALTWLTMWDVGSQINATLAAHQLGLIDAATLATAARRILYQIAGRESQGRLLPNGVIRTDLVRRGSSDFDGCDAGRLLAALDNLDRHSDLGDEISALVSSWDLEAILIDGAIHSVKDGQLMSTYASHCAHYAARAFGRWGFEARSPYRTFEGRTPSDGEMALLETVAGIGPLGAEPLLLEAMELGMSPEAAYLADVLRVAQIEEFEASGTLMAVSEMPIRREPWFVYLGLQLGREPREWGIDVVDGMERYRARDFLDQNMALSSKAAYLWAAYAPGAYSDALVARIREAGRLPVGFASNVGAADTTAAAPFTDLNTNAVILQAIAHMLVPGQGDGTP